MIKYNSKTLNDWYFADDNIIKVYHNGAVVFYKVSSSSGSTPTFNVCYAVVNDITQYQETEFVDVFDKATKKWYKLNNLNQYEEYGVYGSGIDITYYEGKLTIDNGYEYEWNGSSWVNVGELSGSSKEESWVAATELIESTSYRNNTYTITKWKDNISVFHGMKLDKGNGGLGSYCWADFKSPDYSSGYILSIPSSIETHFKYHGISYYPNEGGTMPSCFTLDNGWYIFDFDKMSSDDGYSGTYLYSYQENFEIEKMYFLTTVYAPEYPKYYSEKSEPLSDLTFNTLDAAQEYAYNNCVYDGMRAIIGGDRYYFDSEDENGWVEIQNSLPDVPFSVNYNAKNYDANTKTLLKTEGQLVDVDAVITAGTPTVKDGYLTIETGTRATISGYQTYFNRTESNPNMTIISKQRTNNGNCHMFANRDNIHNWMYRCYSDRLVLHGSSEQGVITVTTQPVIESVRVDSNRKLTYNNYTDSTLSTLDSFNYGNTNNGKFALFQGYARNSGEYFSGDFYWVYMSQYTLTDEQVQQVIDYNENL